MIARAAVLVALVACSGPAAADKTDEALAAASADLANVVGQAHLAGTWRVAQLRWDSTAKTTIAEVAPALDADPADPLADPPRVIATTFQLVIGPPARIVTHADPAALRTAATTGPVALAAARARVKQETRYLGWRSSKTRYETTVMFARGRVFVMFSPPNITDSEISIEVDPTTGAVVAVRLGMA